MVPPWIFVEDVAALRAELVGAGVSAITEIVDQEWGNLEMTVTDPDGNQICLAQTKQA